MAAIANCGIISVYVLLPGDIISINEQVVVVTDVNVRQVSKSPIYDITGVRRVSRDGEVLALIETFPDFTAQATFQRLDIVELVGLT
jgi:hypothetical protein